MAGKARIQQDLFDDQVDAVLAASRVLVGVTAESIAALDDAVTITQLRALVIIASRGPMHLTALAEAMRVHPSNATRTCDRLVELGLLSRHENATDRRHLVLDLTTAGSGVVDSVMHRRRRSIAAILRRMSASDRDRLADVLTEFALAGGEPADDHLWSVGWITETAAPSPAQASGAAISRQQ